MSLKKCSQNSPLFLYHIPLLISVIFYFLLRNHNQPSNNHIITEKEQPTNFKILMFPWLAHGHINPFLELAKRLSTTRNFTIYICSTRVNLDSIKTNTSYSIRLIELHIPSSPELPPEMLTTKNLPSTHVPALLRAFQTSGPSFSETLESVKPDLLIYDFIQPWATKLSINIPSVLFATSGASAVSFYHHLHTMGLDSPFPYRALYLLDHEKADVINPDTQHVNADLLGDFTLSTDIVLVKSSREVEGKYIDYLSHMCKKRVVPTGPLIAHDNLVDHDDDHQEIMKCLGKKSHCSTVYISFGSEYFLSKEQIAEIAKGLQKLSVEVSFLWVIRFPHGGKPAALPVGFLETVKERGKLIEGWAPQTEILAHPSIGGFVSHCGWSSITESMYFGVPVVGMPMKVDQPINARLAVEVGVGLEVEKDENGNYVGDEVAKVINKVMRPGNDEFYEGMRDRVRGLSKKMKENAENEVDETIVEQLMRICMK